MGSELAGEVAQLLRALAVEMVRTSVWTPAGHCACAYNPSPEGGWGNKDC